MNARRPYPLYFIIAFAAAALAMPSTINAQSNGGKSLKQLEADMIKITDSMYDAPIPELGPKYSLKLIKTLKEALSQPDSYKYPFDSLGKKINFTASPDNAFRIINWAVMQPDFTHRYYGAIQMNSSKLTLYPLIDISTEVTEGLDDSIFVGPRWFGGLIYSIMPKEVAGKTVYFLLSKNDANEKSTFKVVEPMQLTAEGPRFGLPVFAIASTTRKGARANRFVLEYKKGVQASLNWKEEFKALVFDRLASVGNDPSRKYTYAPTGQYDALRWDGEKWIYLQDIIPLVELKDGEAPSTEDSVPRD